MEKLIKKYKLTRFNLLEYAGNKWKVDGQSSTGSRRRIKFKAINLEDAIAQAEQLLNPQASQENITIAQALIRSKQDRKWTEYQQEHDNKSCRYFLDWCDAQNIKYWSQLNYESMQKYKKYLEDRNLAYNTIRLYFHPIRRTAAWVECVWPKEFVNICRGIRFKQETRNKRVPYMTIHQVLDFLDWILRQNDEYRHIIAAGVALQGLAGMSLREVFRLVKEDFDMKEATVSIQREAKNKYRFRTLPIPATVLWLVKNALEDRERLIPFSDFLDYSKAIKRRLKKWKPELDFTPKDFRNTLQTEAIDNDWYGTHVKRYVGHSPDSIGERHYHGDEPEKMIAQFKDKVVARVEEQIQSWNAPTDTAILPYPRLIVNQ